MKKTKSVQDILVRYAVLIALAFPNLWIFYFVFSSLTIYPVYFLLNIFFDSTLIDSIIIANGAAIELIPACIAGSAYYLLTILNLSTSNIKIKKRIKILAIAFASFLVFNILRIFLLSVMSIKSSPLFDVTHLFFWYVVSIVLVVAIWFAEVKIFKIKEIPIYSDIKFLYLNSRK